jgi:hypothetical protein
MNRRSSIVGLSAILALGLVVLPGPAVSQPPPLKERLVGTWTFVSAVEVNKDGTKTDQWGPSAKGLFILAENGRYSLIIARSDLPKFVINNRDQETAAENKAVVQGVLANIGTWSVDEANKTLTKNIEAGSFPNFQWYRPETEYYFSIRGRT